MIPARLRQLVTLQLIASWLITISFGFLSTEFQETFRQAAWWRNVWIVLPLILLIGLTLYVFAFLRHNIHTVLQHPITLATPQLEQQHARRGLVAFVSNYTPQRDSGNPMLDRPSKEWREAAKANRYDDLHLEKSNLLPIITAITKHSSKLEHCWLISTAGDQGSYPYAKMLAAYVKEKLHISAQVHYEAQHYAVDYEQEDTKVVQTTYDLIRSIYRKSSLPASDIVADITSAPRSFALGMTLACLDRDHDLQFIGTHYTEGSQPTGKLIPVIYKFEPVLIKQGD